MELTRLHDIYHNCDVLNLQEVENLSQSAQVYQAKKTPYAKKGFLAAFLDYLDLCNRYADDIFKRKTMKKEDVVHKICTTEKDFCKWSDVGKAMYFRSLLYASREYVKRLRSTITIKNIGNYANTYLQIVSDFDWLFCGYETFARHNIVCPSHWERKNSSSRDLIWTMNELSFFENNTLTPMQISYRDIKPMSIFLVRQCLETAGKKLIGYKKLLDGNGQEIPKFSQVAWDYLEKAEQNGYIHLPFSAKVIKKLNSWTNSYIHSTKFYNIFVRFYIVDFINDLFMPVPNAVQTYDGKNKQSLIYGDFKLYNYNQMRTDFQNYLQSRGANGCLIDWLDYQNVEGYIISL